MEEDLIIGFYPRPFKHEFKQVRIKAVLDSFSSEAFKSMILIARDLYSKKEFEKYTLFKNNLPAVTFSGTFSPSRTSSNIHTYSHVIVMDVDKIGDELEDLIFKLFNDRYVLSAWLSPSGHGIKFLIINGLEMKDHKDIYKGAVAYFSSTYGIKLDTSGSDMSRLCFVSYDPNIKIKSRCDPFISIPNEETVLKEAKNKKLDISFNSFPKIGQLKNDEISKKSFKKLYHYLYKRNLSITESHENWVRVGYAISNTFNYTVGRTYFLDLCRLDGINHDEELSEKLIRTCYANGLSQSSFATILFLAFEKGYDVNFNAKNNVKKKKIKK